MSTTPPDDAPGSNPYEAPRTGAGPGRAVARGLGAGVGVVVIVLSCLVAFVATCVPVGAGMMGMTRDGGSGPFVIACVVGLVVAGLVGVGLAKAFFGGKR